MSLLNFQSKKRNIFVNSQSQQQRSNDQEDSAFQFSQDCTQMMNSQENSQSSSFDLFSQMMSQQQGLSQQNEVAPSHRFYTKYMSKAPLFGRESSQSDKNPLPRRLSYQDINEANRQRAKDRDDRDLINTFIALVKECADEVKSAADDIKSNVNRSMKESANKSASLMKKINEDLSEHYNSLLDSIKETEAEKSKIAELEQALASKEARIEVLESQLEVANAAKDERMIQSIVDAYKEQQNISRDHMNRIHEEQQKFTKEQVEIITSQQQEQIEKMEKSHSVEFSEKQPAKSLESIPSVQTDITHDVDGNKRNTLLPFGQQPFSSTVNNQSSDILPYNLARPTGMPTNITAVQPPQPLQVTSQMSTSQAANYATCSDQRCNSRGFCMDCEYNIPRCSSSSAMSFQPISITASNLNQSIHNTSSHLPPPQYHYQVPVPDVRTIPQHSNQQPTLPTRRPNSVPSNAQPSSAFLYPFTSPISDHPVASLWSKANRLKPSPVATVAPQVKNESCSPEYNADDTQEIIDQSDQGSPEEVQQRRSRQSAARRQVNQPQPRRHSARVQAKRSSNNMQSDLPETPADMTRSKTHKIHQQKRNQRQKSAISKQVHSRQTGRPNHKNKAANVNQQRQQEQDIYEFEDAAPIKIPPAKRQKTSRGMEHTKISSNKSYQQLKHSSNSSKSGNVKQLQMGTVSSKVYPDWVTQPAKNIFKKSHPQLPKSSDQWLIQDSGTTEYDFQDEYQSSDALSQEQVQPSRRIKDQKSNDSNASRSRMASYQNDDDVESSEEISFSLQSPGITVYPKKHSGFVKQQQQQQQQRAVIDDFLSTPCLQPAQYDSDDSQLISGYTSGPGSAVRRKVSRQVERKRRLQAVPRQAEASQTLAEISKSISKHRSKLRRSTSVLSMC